MRLLVAIGLASSIVLGALVGFLVPAPSSGTPTDPSIATSTDPTVDPSATPSPSVEPKPEKTKKPKPATSTKKAKNVPEFPRDKREGRRIVYDKKLMTVWLMNKDGSVEARFRVTGRQDRPDPGTYRIYSKSEHSASSVTGVTYNHMVRFAHGPSTGAPIGFHSIPRTPSGQLIHPVSSLGLAIAIGGCVRLADEQAQHLYKWAKVGDKVVVLAA